jgi:hypothetical protein
MNIPLYPENSDLVIRSVNSPISDRTFFNSVLVPPANNAALAVNDPQSMSSEQQRFVGRLLRSIHIPMPGEVEDYVVSIVKEVLSHVQTKDHILRTHDIQKELVYSQFERMVSFESIRTLGICRLHGDFSFSRLVCVENKIDGFEDLGNLFVGSPYEDFAFAAFISPGVANAVWNGYGCIPNSGTLGAFAILRCLRLLKTEELGAIANLKKLINT